MGRIVLVTGGKRAGKSLFAEGYALDRSSSPVYLATAVPTDEEFSRRIEYHRHNRDKRFQTIEESVDIEGVIQQVGESRAIVWECVTTWLANIFHAQKWTFSTHDERLLWKRLEDIGEIVRRQDHVLVVVTNEIGLGIIPQDETSRRYSDVLGWCNQRLARMADEVYFVVSGLPWRLK